ncbi:hypothetical protein HMI54_008325 [Coelomomyces lativittatus]|nr:hypothetical protein HMI54_008325 [Coelomomyces lativittatus]KAJ1511497.1 hypothetical protein HMI55_006572 [Coelomomyces lativittatus]KAJ1515113.1 hypothetical protein HMI56_006570 [Coelomomyces lativittatus]
MIPKANPNIVVCYLCGREFTIYSLKIHEPQCLRKWEVEESKKPSHLQRSPPPRPSLPSSLHPDTHLTKNENETQPIQWTDPHYSQLAMETYLTMTRVPCEICGRKFASEDRLKVHQRSCKPTSTLTTPVVTTRTTPPLESKSMSTLSKSQSCSTHPCDKKTTGEVKKKEGRSQGASMAHIKSMEAPNVKEKNLNKNVPSKVQSQSLATSPSNIKDSLETSSQNTSNPSVLSSSMLTETHVHDSTLPTRSTQEVFSDKFCCQCGKAYLTLDHFCSQCGQKRK